jgi:hypothetical protein
MKKSWHCFFYFDKYINKETAGTSLFLLINHPSKTLGGILQSVCAVPWVFRDLQDQARFLTQILVALEEVAHDYGGDEMEGLLQTRQTVNKVVSEESIKNTGQRPA